MTNEPSIRNIRAAAGVRLARLAGTYAEAPADAKEELLAGIEFERELLEACADATPDWP